MSFSFVTFATLLVLIKSLYAAPIGESVGKSTISVISTNENVLSGAFTTEAVAATWSSTNDLDDSDDEPILARTRKQVDTQQSSNKSSFKCFWENCNQSFDSVTVLSKHIQSHLVKRQKYYKCKWENCNYGCFQLSDLQNHLRKHTKERPFVCQYDGCGLSFTQKCNMKKHIKDAHSSRVESISPLEQECESDDNEVQQPALLHCDWKNCNSEFNDVTLLSNHVKKDHIGSGKSCYECQWKDCSYVANFRSKMQSHIRTHTKEKPFICSYNGCGKSFTQRGTLNQHMKIHLDDGYFLCPLLDCDKKYSKIESIRKHLHFHAAASNYSISDVDSIWNAFRKKIPYPADISNRIKLKQQRIIEKNYKQESKITSIGSESNQKQTNRDEDYSGTSTNEIEGNISNEIQISDPDLDLDLDSILCEVTCVDESNTDHSKDNKEPANDVTECISFTDLCKDGADCNKRHFDFDNEVDNVSKKIKSTHVIDNDNSMNCYVAYCLDHHQNLQSPFSPLSLEIKLEQLFDS